MSAVTRHWRDRFLTTGWNNRLATVLGLLAALFAATALFTSAFSDRAGFIGMVMIGAVY